MAVRKRVEKTANVNIDYLIDKGAKVKEDRIYERKITQICLRLPVKMLDAIDAAVTDRIGLRRTGWILQAIEEKLKRNH